MADQKSRHTGFVTFTVKKNNSKMPEAVIDDNQRDKWMMMTELPVVSIDAMTQAQFRKFIPRLIRFATGRVQPHYGKAPFKPVWWPKHVPWADPKRMNRAELGKVSWTDSMRNIIRHCYSYFGHEHLLKDENSLLSKNTSGITSHSKPLCVMEGKAFWDNKRLKSSSHKSCNDWNGSSRQYKCKKKDNSCKKDFVEIYICFFCEREFTNKDLMRHHQNNCSYRPLESYGMHTPPRQLSTAIYAKWNMPRTPATISVNDYPRENKDFFLKALNLVQTQKAETIKSSKSTDVDCRIIDVEPQDMVLQSSPRTPKSLISQLSREGELGLNKKRLSYTSQNDDSDGESVSSNMSEDIDGFKKSQKNNSLLCIDISSLLGQRIQKHVKAETASQILPDIEQFCKTPVKNDFLERLRTRPVLYPVTFRSTKKMNSKYSHEYKFSKSQNKEFMKRLKTGLNKRSRKLKHSIRQCSVQLKRLTKEEIEKWTTHQRNLRIDLKPLTSAQILLWTAKKKYMNDLPSIPSPSQSQNASLKHGVTKRFSGQQGISDKHDTRNASKEKAMKKMTVYKSVLSTSKSKSAAVSKIADQVNNMRRQSELSRLLNHCQHKQRQSWEHGSNSCKSFAGDFSGSQSMKNSSSNVPRPQFLVKRLDMDVDMQGSATPQLLVIPVSESSGIIPHEQLSPQSFGSASHTSQKGAATAAQQSSNCKLNVLDDEISVKTLSSDEEDSWNLSCCSGCKNHNNCHCQQSYKENHNTMYMDDPQKNFKLSTDRQNNQAFFHDRAIEISDTEQTVGGAPLHIIVNYNVHSCVQGSSENVSCSSDMEASPKRVYSPTARPSIHFEKQNPIQVMSGAQNMCSSSSPLKVISCADYQNSKGNSVFSEGKTDLALGRYLNRQKTHSFPSAWQCIYDFNNSKNIKVQTVECQSPNSSELDDDIQILEEIICID